jgi:hypothetical protein
MGAVMAELPFTKYTAAVHCRRQDFGLVDGFLDLLKVGIGAVLRMEWTDEPISERTSGDHAFLQNRGVSGFNKTNSPCAAKRRHR